MSSPYTIRQRNSGRYEVKFYTGTDSNGKKTYKSIHGGTSKELKEKLKEIATEQKKNQTPAANVSFRNYALHWMRLYKYPALKPVSYDRSEQIYNKVCEYLEWIQMGNISTDDTQEMINDLVRAKARSTVEKHHEFAKNVFSHAYKTGELNFNPCEAVALPIGHNMTVKTKPVEILSEEGTETMYVFNEKTKKSRNQFFKQVPALLLILNTGWRTGKLLALEWTNIDFKRRTARINKTLAGARTYNDAGESISQHKTTFLKPTRTKVGERFTPLNDMAVSLLKQIEEYNQRTGIRSNYIVRTKDGGYVNERNLSRVLKSVMGTIRAEKDYIIHSLRHICASRLLKRSVDVGVTSKLLGHSDINTTYGRYIHVPHTRPMQSVQSVERIQGDVIKPVVLMYDIVRSSILATFLFRCQVDGGGMIVKQVIAETISQMSDAEILGLLGDMRDIPISSERKAWKSPSTGAYNSSGKLIGDRTADEDDYVE